MDAVINGPGMKEGEVVGEWNALRRNDTVQSMYIHVHQMAKCHHHLLLVRAISSLQSESHATLWFVPDGTFR
jgi:hypothetical protein